MFAKVMKELLNSILKAPLEIVTGRFKWFVCSLMLTFRFVTTVTSKSARDHLPNYPTRDPPYTSWLLNINPALAGSRSESNGGRQMQKTHSRRQTSSSPPISPKKQRLSSPSPKWHSSKPSGRKKDLSSE